MGRAYLKVFLLSVFDQLRLKGSELSHDSNYLFFFFLWFFDIIDWFVLLVCDIFSVVWWQWRTYMEERD